MSEDRLPADRAPAALVIGRAGEADPDGIEVLAVVRGIDPTASRVAAVGWGERDTARSQELRDTFSRSGIPIGFYDANTERGRQILRELGAESAELPVVVIRFGGQRPTLVNPSNLEITGTRSYA